MGARREKRPDRSAQRRPRAQPRAEGRIGPPGGPCSPAIRFTAWTPHTRGRARGLASHIWLSPICQQRGSPVRAPDFFSTRQCTRLGSSVKSYCSLLYSGPLKTAPFLLASPPGAIYYWTLAPGLYNLGLLPTTDAREPAVTSSTASPPAPPCSSGSRSGGWAPQASRQRG